MAACLPVGCGPSNFETYYVPQPEAPFYEPLPESYPVRIMRLGNVDPVEAQRSHYPGATLLGVSRFTDTPGSDEALAKFARSIGADAVLWQMLYLDTYQELDYHHYHDTRETKVTTTGKDGTKTKTTIRDSEHRAVPYTRTHHIFRQHLRFLRSEENLPVRDAPGK